MRAYEKWASLIVILFVFALGVLDRPAQAANSKFVPKLMVGYNYDNNVAAVDPDLVDPVAMQWISYLVGLDASFKTQYYLLQLGGSAGYDQYINSSSELKNLWDVNYRRFDYYHLDLHGLFSYTRPNFAIDLADDLIRSRLISDIFQTEISDFSDLYLYTDNVASAQVRFPH